MSADNQQETQEIENTETPETTETISATEKDKPTIDEHTVAETEVAVDENKEEENPPKEEDIKDVLVEEELDFPNLEEEVPSPVTDYLDPSILDIKVVNEEDLGKYEEAEAISEDLNDQYADTFTDIREKEVVTGTVVGITDRDVLVDIGFKAEGIIHRTEFKELPEPGQEIDVFIITFEDRKGNIILSKERADFQKRWTEIRNCFDNDELITGLITRRIKGGMVVDLGVVQAFLPGSQLDIKPILDFDEFLGVESEFKIVKFNELRQNIVLSRKAILEDDMLEKRQAVLEDMEIGMELEGMVKNITDFGAFIDLGGIDGLLHITDITWGRINHPSDRLTLGEKINVKVIDFDIEKVRVSLGVKQLHPEPWEGISDKYPVDSIIDGTIVNMMNYGAFIELEEGVEGLIHISEMSWTRHIKHPSDMYKVGDKVQAKILNIDPNEKKISLGLKQLQENPWDTITSKFPVGTDHEGVVRNLTQFGAFIELEEGIDGLVHVSDMSWTKLVRHPKELVQKGDTIKVRILEVSSEDRRLGLGIKQIEENPWEKIRNDFPSGKVVNGTIIKILDKGIIFDLENSLEGIVPIKQMNKQEKNQLLTSFKEGDSHEVTVQEVDEEYKKIILIIDLGFEVVEGEEKPEEALEESESDKIEISQDIIDKVSEDNIDKETVQEAEGVDEISKDDSEKSEIDSSDVDDSKDE